VNDVTFTFNTEQILLVCGLITAIGGASVYIGKVIKTVKKPNEEQNRRITALELWKADVDTKLDRDKQSIETLGQEMHLLIKATNALLAHGIDGNSVQPMRESKEEITNYLIKK
jgi:hypothetical protein